MCKIYISQSIYIIRFSTFFNRKPFILFLHTVTFISITFFLLFYFIFFIWRTLPPTNPSFLYYIPPGIIIRFSTFFNRKPFILFFTHSNLYIYHFFFIILLYFFYMENLTPTRGRSPSLYPH